MKQRQFDLVLLKYLDQFFLSLIKTPGGGEFTGIFTTASTLKANVIGNGNFIQLMLPLVLPSDASHRVVWRDALMRYGR